MGESKYHIKVSINPGECEAGYINLDWYRLIRNTEAQRKIRSDPSVEHAFKKIWSLGERGSKSAIKDAQECIASLQSFIDHEQTKGK